MGGFGGTAGRIDEGDARIFSGPPEALGSARVELWNGHREGQSGVTLDGADFEASAGSPVGAALRSAHRIGQFRAEFVDDVNLEGADGGISGLVVGDVGHVVGAPSECVARADAFGLFNLGQADVVGKVRLVPVNACGSVTRFDPDVARTADHLR